MIQPTGIKIVPNNLSPISEMRFAGTQNAKKLIGEKLMQSGAWQCAYCGKDFNKDKKKGERIPPTFDHIRPQKLEGDNKFYNGILCCPTCNTNRGNTPFLEFLQGTVGVYEYNRHTNTVSQSKFHLQRPREEVVKLIQNFSRYLRMNLENYVRNKEKVSWFPNAMQNILFPLPRPNNTSRVSDEERQRRDQTILNRMETFMRILVTADKGYWLSPRFEDQVNREFANQPNQKNQFEPALLRRLLMETLHHLRLMNYRGENITIFQD
jgi:hypothetical protein